jgi:hypothetical protein
MGRKFVSGHAGRMPRTFIGGNEFCQTKYEYTEVAEEEDTTCSTGAGYNEFEYGNRHIEGSMEADWDAGANPYNDPPTLRAGEEYSFRGYIHAPSGAGNEAGPLLEIDKMKINNVKVSCPSKGKITVSFDFKSSGPYSLPTQTSDSSSGL